MASYQRYCEVSEIMQVPHVPGLGMLLFLHHDNNNKASNNFYQQLLYYMGSPHRRYQYKDLDEWKRGSQF